MTTERAPVEIRRIGPNDLAICARIHTDAWNAALPAVPRSIDIADLEAEIEGELTLVATADERVVGYVSVCEDEWFIHHLYVDPVSRGVGIGTTLISHVERLAASHPISLKCLTANHGAMGFYEASGFARTSETGTDEHGTWVRLAKAGDAHGT